MRDNIIQKKSYEFTHNVIVLYRKLCKANEFVLSKQLLRSGTSIGANVEEALAGQSRADFISIDVHSIKGSQGIKLLAPIAERQQNDRYN